MNYYPLALSTQAVDKVFFFIVGCGLVLLLLVTAVMITFTVRYRRSRHPQSQPVADSTLLEIVWTLLPTVLVLVMFFYGLQGFRLIRGVPAGAMKVTVTGRMWQWSYTYENGRQSKTLYVPFGKPIKLILRSLDVIHSFYIPSLRIKESVVPGRENYLWFQPESMGPAQVFCAEYCGQQHAYMLSKIVVLKEQDFASWYGSTDPAAEPLPDPPGLAVMKKRSCLGAGCHTVEEWALPGQLSLRRVYGAKVTVRRDGKLVQLTADEEYLRRAIRDPGRELVRGFPNIMPRQTDMSDEEIGQVVAFLKSLR